jgi:hypothetical protein
MWRDIIGQPDGVAKCKWLGLCERLCCTDAKLKICCFFETSLQGMELGGFDKISRLSYNYSHEYPSTD